MAIINTQYLNLSIIEQESNIDQNNINKLTNTQWK